MQSKQQPMPRPKITECKVILMFFPNLTLGCDLKYDKGAQHKMLMQLKFFGKERNVWCSIYAHMSAFKSLWGVITRKQNSILGLRPSAPLIYGGTKGHSSHLQSWHFGRGVEVDDQGGVYFPHSVAFHQEPACSDYFQVLFAVLGRVAQISDLESG